MVRYLVIVLFAFGAFLFVQLTGSLVPDAVATVGQTASAPR
jgi:hypothetical protein